MKYINADLLRKEIERLESENNCGTSDFIDAKRIAYDQVKEALDSLPKQPEGEISDGYHTFNELYYYRMLYNAAFFNSLPKEWVHKSKRHHTGEECFGGGWFIVMAELPTGQISNHYELKDWDLFQIPEKEFADEWDGHAPQEAAERLYKYLQQEQPVSEDLEEEISTWISTHISCGDDEVCKNAKNAVIEWAGVVARHFYELGRNARKEE